MKRNSKLRKNCSDRGGRAHEQRYSSAVARLGKKALQWVSREVFTERYCLRLKRVAKYLSDVLFPLIKTYVTLPFRTIRPKIKPSEQPVSFFVFLKCALVLWYLTVSVISYIVDSIHNLLLLYCTACFSCSLTFCRFLFEFEAGDLTKSASPRYN